MKSKINKRLFLLAGTLLIISACNTIHPSSYPLKDKLPAAFIKDADTTSIATMPWNTFFSDDKLVALIDVVLKNNHDLAIALQKVEVARSYFKMNAGAMLPSVNAAANVSGTKYADYSMEGVGNTDLNQSTNITDKQHIPGPVTPNYFLGFNSSWEIDIWRRLNNKKKAAYMRYLATENGKNIVITTLVAEVAYRYYELLALDKETAIVNKNIELQQRALDIVVAQQASGRATALAVKQFEAQLLHTRNMELEIKQNTDRVENEINYLAGRFPQAVERSSTFNDDLGKMLSAGIPSELLKRRPDILLSEMELKASDHDLAAAKAAFYPSLTLSPYIGYNSFNSSLLFQPSTLAYGFIGGLSAPIFNRNLIRSDYKRAKAESKMAYYTYEKTILNAFIEVLTSLKSIDKQNKSYAIYTEEAKILNDAIHISNDLYFAGFATYLEVITAQKNAVEADMNVIRMKKNICFSVINLYKALGGGWKS